MAKKTWIVASGAAGDYSASASWSPAGVPAAGDDIYVGAGTGSISSGLNQSGVAINSFTVAQGYSGTIGTATSDLAIKPSNFVFWGLGQSYINLGPAVVSPQIFDTMKAGIGLRGLYLKGQGIVTLAVMGGQVGLAARFGETSICQTARIVGKGASLWVGEGCSIDNFHQYDGDNELRTDADAGAFGTSAVAEVICYGGKLKIVGSGFIDSLTTFNGTCLPESTGGITLLVMNGGTTSFLGHGSPRAVSQVQHNPPASFHYDPDVLTISAWVAPVRPVNMQAIAV